MTPTQSQATPRALERHTWCWCGGMDTLRRQIDNETAIDTCTACGGIKYTYFPKGWVWYE